MVESKSAEELALEMFLQEARTAKCFRRMADSAALYGEGMLVSQFYGSARFHRRNVSMLARIIRAIREERRLSRRGESEHYTSRGEVNGG